jgi:hypothetical protein
MYLQRLPITLSAVLELAILLLSFGMHSLDAQSRYQRQLFRLCWREPHPGLVRRTGWNSVSARLAEWAALAGVKVMESAGAADWRCESTSPIFIPEGT